MIRHDPCYLPLWLAKRQWRLNGRKWVGPSRAFVISYLLASREDRWQIWTGPYATLDGRRRQPAFYGRDQ